MKIRIAIITTAILLTAPAFARKPPIFNPHTPLSWGYARQQAADKLLDALFDACPKIDTYLDAIDDANLGLLNAAWQNWRGDTGVFRRHDWRQAVTLDLDINVRVATQLPKPGMGHTLFVTFLLVGGDMPGIYMQMPPANAAQLCGAKGTRPVHFAAVALDNGETLPAYNDAFVPVRAMAAVDHF